MQHELIQKKLRFCLFVCFNVSQKTVEATKSIGEEYLFIYRHTVYIS